MKALLEVKNEHKLDLSSSESVSNNVSEFLFRPEVFRMSSETDVLRFKTFLDKSYSHITIHNNIENQLKELHKTLNPKQKLKDKTLADFYKNWLLENDPDSYGTWVYYPWTNRLVHLLEEDDFILLRTSRNQYKITPEEQRSLSQKKLGVIGLSVGQSVAVTMAMERVFGTLRIADFDQLDLSNLNRIRSGVANIGLPKTVLVAREIAEIDPFLNLELFNEGITEENLDQFIGEGEQRLDLLVEECDSLDIKIKARLRARAKGVPVIMDTSDRGMMDIERFDQDPNLPIMHGMVDEERAEQMERWTAKERLALVMDMVGAENISSRLKASLLEVEESLTTWPQLASSVVLGGAISTIVVRRILLGEQVDSGRYYLDVDQKFIQDNSSSSKLSASSSKPAELSFKDCEQLLSEADLRLPQDCLPNLSAELMEDLVESACLAPSGGNVQPWKWVYKEGLLALFHDIHHSYSFLDYRHRGSFIGLGAAKENLRQRALAQGLQLVELNRPEEFGQALIGVFSFKKLDFTPGPLDQFGDRLDIRLTNRKKSLADKTLPGAVKGQIEAELQKTPFSILWIEDPEKVKALAEIIGKIERQRILDPWGHSDFMNEARWTGESAEKTRTGVDLRTMDLTEADKVGFKLIRDPEAIGSLRKWDRGSALIKMSADAIENAKLCLLYTMDHSPVNVYEGGAWVEKLWLYFNDQGIAYQPVSPATFMFARLADEDSGTSDYLRANLTKLREEYLNLLGLPETVNDLFLSRIFYAEEPRVKSLRKPLSTVFKNLNNK